MRFGRIAFVVVVAFVCPALAGAAFADDAARTSVEAKVPRLPVVAKRPRIPLVPIVAARPEPLPPWGLDARTPWTTSKVVGSPDPPLPYRLKRVFPKLEIKEPVYMLPEPGTDRVWLLELKGRIIAFNPNDAEPQPVEIFAIPESKVLATEVYSFTFHPQYIENGQVFLFINDKNKEGPDRNEHDRITRFQTSGNPRKIIPESREEIIAWASAGHAGGDMAFCDDGMLYITSGDGTSGSDPDNTGQDITDLRGGILRIDVDHPDEGKPYGIPKDNPFLHIPNARHELWAFGLRAPWRMSFDRETGNLWVGEVGQDLWEMIHLIRRGGNYGWSVMEGTHPFIPDRKLGPGPVIPPIVEHPHSEARSITGGYVYHGSKLKELDRMYIYCCYATGTVWAFRYENNQVTDRRVLADSTYMVAAWGRDHANEIYLLALSGEIFELERNPVQEANASFPTKLSETGIFTSVKDQTPAPGVLPYTVNAPAWADGATVERYLAIPGDGTIEAVASRGWNLTDGSVLVQTLSLPMEEGNPASARYIETRMLTRQGGEWAAYTYLWNDEQTDAELVDKEGLDHKLTIRDASAPGGERTRTWRYAARSECMGCHSRAANYVLGLNTLQMNKPHHYESVTDNQMRTLNHVGFFKPALDKHPSTEKKLVNPYDQTADLGARARSYLHANCSHCHVSDGGGNARMELEFTTEPEKTQIFGITPLHGGFDMPAADLIAPGDPYRSVIYYRISKLGRGRMPQLGSNIVDEEARQLFHDWITQLSPQIAEKAESEAERKKKTPKSLEMTPEEEEAARQARAAALEAKKAAVEAAGRLRERDLAALKILQNGETSDGAARTEAISRLLTTTSGALVLLGAIDDGSIHGPLREEAIALANASSDGQVRDLYERFLPEEKRVKRLGNIIRPEGILALPGDAARGRSLFFDTAGVLCKSCHLIQGQGRDIGPDLSQIGKKYNRAQLLETILEPSKVIDEKYLTFVIETQAGKIHTGLLVERTSDTVVLKDNEGKLVKIAASDIDLMEPQRKSMMPELLLRDMTADQVADLLEYLSGLK